MSCNKLTPRFSSIEVSSKKLAALTFCSNQIWVSTLQIWKVTGEKTCYLKIFWSKFPLFLLSLVFFVRLVFSCLKPSKLNIFSFHITLFDDNLIVVKPMIKFCDTTKIAECLGSSFNNFAISSSILNPISTRDQNF